jgi:hypothetical protein
MQRLRNKTQRAAVAFHLLLAVIVVAVVLAVSYRR